MSARPLPDGLRALRLGADRSTRSPRGTGCTRPQIIRFDQNVPPLPGVPQVPLGESFARLNDYPDGTYRELREAARPTPESSRSRSSPAPARTG